MADKPNINLQEWESWSQTDKAYTKAITGKQYKGTSINPTYIVRKITQTLGPIGVNWGWEVEFDRIREGEPHQVVTEQHQSPDSKSIKYMIIRETYHEVCIKLWRVVDGEKNYFSSYGGTVMLRKTNAGKWSMDEDAAKKSLTDAFTKAASFMGVSADIFTGESDNDKYSAPQDTSAPAPSQGSAKNSADRINSDPF
jgi:hypothetical protein